jgi:integrase
VTDHLSRVRYVENVKSPLTGASAVSADSHAALVDFEIAGHSTQAAERVDPTLAAVAAAQARHSSLDIREFRRRQRQQGDQRGHRRRPRQGGRAVAAGLGQIHAHRLRHTAATRMLRAGGSLEEIGQVLRHRQPLTTAFYAKVDRDALRELARPWPGAGS